MVLNNLRLQRLWIATPVILVLSVFSALVIRALYSSREIANEYRTAARQAIADEDREQAKFYYSRLVGQGDSGTRQDQFNWVSLVAASGDSAGAEKLLGDLAPDDEVGYAPAHLAMAKSLIAKLQQSGADKSDIIPKLAHHLRRGAWDPNPENDVLWAAYHLAVEQYDEAVARYASAASDRPEMWADLAKLYRQMGRTDDASRASKRAAEYFRNELKSKPTDVAIRLRLTEVLAEQDDMAAAETIIRDGLRIAGMNPQLRRAGATLRLMQLKDIDDSDPQADEKRLTLITSAASLSPENPSVYQALSSFYHLGATEDRKAKYRKTLERMIAEGNQVAAAHFALGNIAFLEDRADEAVLHFETAMDINPQMLVVANNLAWVLCEKDEPELDRAEQLIEAAMKKQPNQVSFIDTLSTIKFRMKKYREALPLMEKVLAQARGTKRDEIHQRLAVVYDSLDQPSLAQSHRDQIVGSATAEQ